MAAGLTLKKSSGGQITLVPEDGTTSETIIIPSTGVGGKILQVRQVREPNVLSFGVASNSTTFIPTLATTVTPKSPNSKFLIRWNIRLGHNASSLYLKAYVNGVQIGNGTSTLTETSSSNQQWWDSGSTYTRTAIYSYWGENLYQHSGSDTFNFTIAFRTQTGQTVYLNRAQGYFDIDRGSTDSYVMIMEVAD